MYCTCLCVYVFVYACSPLPLSFECYQDECAPYVCQLQSLSETGVGDGGWGGLIHVYISLWVTEHLRPEVRKKSSSVFWKG